MTSQAYFITNRVINQHILVCIKDGLHPDYFLICFFMVLTLLINEMRFHIKNHFKRLADKVDDATIPFMRDVIRDNL